MAKYVFAGVGTSADDDAYKAGKEAAENSMEDMRKQGGKKPTFGLVFCSGGKYGKDDGTIKNFVRGVHSVFGSTPWIGCTTAGEITPDGVKQNSVIATVLSTEYIKFGIGYSDNVSKKPSLVGKKVAKMALKNIKMDKYLDAYISYVASKNKKASQLIRQKQFAMIALSAGFTMKKAGWEEEMIEGIKSVVGSSTPIVGGSAADSFREIKNYQFVNGKVFNDALVAAVLFSNLKLDFGLAHGFTPTNSVAVVTKAKNNIVYELNGKPALEEYARLIGFSRDELLKGYGFMGMGKYLPSVVLKLTTSSFTADPKKMMDMVPFLKSTLYNPFGVPDIHGEYILKVPRYIIDDKYLDFTAKIPLRCTLVLMKQNEKKSIMATSTSVRISFDSFKKKPALSIIFECAGRFLSLGKLTPTSVKELKRAMGTTPFLGFYTGAEFGFTKDMSPNANAYTCTSISISDEMITEK